MLSLLTNFPSVITHYLSKLQDIKPGGKAYDSAILKGAEEALTKTRERIHGRGLAGDGSAIGTYSTTPMYVSMARATGDPAGKSGKTAFASGNAHKSRYFGGGYKDYKTAMGQNANTVNLTLTGEMRDSYHVIKTAEGYGLGWESEPLSQRAAALEQKYGKKIWTLTEEERKALIDTVSEGLK